MAVLPQNIPQKSSPLIQFSNKPAGISFNTVLSPLTEAKIYLKLVDLEAFTNKLAGISFKEIHLLKADLKVVTSENDWKSSPGIEIRLTQPSIAPSILIKPVRPQFMTRVNNLALAFRSVLLSAVTVPEIFTS